MSQRGLTARDYIEDMIENCQYVSSFLRHHDGPSFASNVMVQYAVLRALEIIGEAARQIEEVAPDMPARFPSVPFRVLYAMRNRIIHGYATLDLDTLWSIATSEVPPLQMQLQNLLANWPVDLT